MKRLPRWLVLITLLFEGAAVPRLLAGSFTANFNNALVPPNTSIFGSAVVESFGGVSNSGVLKLTKNIASQQGSFIVSDFDAGLPVVTFTAQFKVLVGGGTQPPADGFSFCWAPDLPNAAFGEEGAGTGFIAAFDIFDNGNGEAPAVDVRFNGVTLGSRKLPLSFLESGTNFWDVFIRVAPDGTLDLFYHTNVIYTKFVITNFHAFAGARFGFGARTGGFTENHWVDDVQITTTQATPPTISNIANQTINEDAPFLNLPFTIGDDRTPAANLLLSASSTNTTLIPLSNITFGGSGANRTVTLIPAADQFGTTLLTITVTDGDGATASDSFLLTVNPVNDAPNFRVGPNQTINEDAGPQTVAGWATAITAGPANESNQNLTFVIIGNGNPTLFSAGPAVSSTGTLTYTPAPNANGNAIIALLVQDDGGTANGGVDVSKAQNFSIMVLPVNDPPTLNQPSNPAAVNEDAGVQTVNFSGVSAGGGESQALSVTASSDNPALIPNPTVNYTSPNSFGSLSYTPVANASGSAFITVTVRDAGPDGIPSNADDGIVSRTFTVIVNPVNDSPTLNQPSNPAAVNEDAGVQTVNFSGVSAGGGESQALSVTASSDNPALIPNPTVNYTSPNATGSLSYTPVANASGSAFITVTVRDAGLDGIPGNADDGIVSRTFTVIVNAVNDPPTLDAISDPAAINEDAGVQTVNLSGITAGGGETQALAVTATSDNPGLIPNPTVNYTSPNATGSLSYVPVANVSGSAMITVTVRDAGLDGVAGNTDDGTVTRTFRVTVNAVNDPPTLSPITGPVAINEDASSQIVSLFGITAGGGESQALAVTAISDNPGLIPNPTVNYTSPNTSGSLSYTPLANANGTALITVTVRDAGFDAIPGNADDGTFSRGFSVTVNAVNDAPSFTKGADQTVNQNAGAQTVAGWATGISAGPPDESNQTVSFNITGNSNPSLFAAGPAVSSSGTLAYTPATNANGSATITLVARDNGGIANGGVDTSLPQTFTIMILAPSPPTIILQPRGQTVGLGNNITLFVVAAGTSPLSYQWRHNGANIRGATAINYSISAFGLADAGSYSVAVANRFGTAVSDTVRLLPDLPSAPLNDNFAARSTISTASFLGLGSNRGATKEQSEPNHAGNPGGKSVWFRWTPPITGIATVGTLGSSFDTLLAVYQGTSLTSLGLLAQDDDRGGFFTSQVQFNVVAGQSYEVAIDGFMGAAGDLVLSLSVEPTSDLLPVISTQPSGQTVRLGVNVTFSVTASAGSPTPTLTYQWLKDDVEIPTATSSTFTIPNVRPANVGAYTVRVAQGVRAVLSRSAILQINTSAIGTVVDRVAARDKYGDALLAALTQSVPLGGLSGSPPPRPPPASGYTGTQIFSTSGASKEQGEPNHCGILGGASEWFIYQAPDDGAVAISTDGTSFNSVLTVYTNNGPVIDLTNLVSVACADNGGSGGTNLVVTFPAKKNTLYSIAVDGVGAETGTVHLTYQLVGPIRITAWSFNTGQFQLQFIGQPGANLSLQESTSLTSWSTLLMTNSASGNAIYTDTSPPAIGRRYYRVLQQ